MSGTMTSRNNRSISEMGRTQRSLNKFIMTGTRSRDRSAEQTQSLQNMGINDYLKNNRDIDLNSTRDLKIYSRSKDLS